MGCLSKFGISYSHKNIPTPDKDQYLHKLTEKIEVCAKRIEWKAWHALNPGKKDDKESYGFSTTASVPRVDELNEFIQDFSQIPQKITFKKPPINELQNKMKQDVKKIKETPEFIIKGDKSDNLYKIDTNEYKKKLIENVSKEYKKVSRSEVDKVNKEAAKIADELKIADRIDVYKETSPFITLKDHKENFENKPTFRLINPAKSNIGKISKQLLEKINKRIREINNLEQWVNSAGTIKWFQNLQEKEKLKFIKFDVVNFYPSISEELLKEAIKWAKNYVAITENEINIILHARKSFIIHEGEVWVKKTNRNFDVTQGSYDGAEVAELVGLYLLSKVNKILPEAGIYRDDGLAVTKKSGPEIAKIEKRLHTLFKNNGLKITIEPSTKTTDFLDIWFNLETGRHKPWKKPNSNPKYVHKDSCHPKPVIKAIPKMISNRLQTLSSTEEEFKDVKDEYETALKDAGYVHEMKFDQNNSAGSNNKKKRSRKIVWFNPPFSNEVATNLTKLFNSLIKKHFKPGTLMGKLFNKNNLKLSYSCCQNIGSIINKHNRKLLNPNKNTEKTEKCNCRGGLDNCPVQGKCREKDVLYNADIKLDGEDEKLYIGATASEFKVRHSNHKSSLKHEKYKHSTMLSTYVWENKDKNPQVKYSIKKKVISYRPEIGKCNLCIEEKKQIILADKNKIVNANNEILTKCRHRNKFLLENLIVSKTRKK